jgi:hypothetical protein
MKGVVIMLNNEKIKQYAGCAKHEIELAIKLLKGGYANYDLDYVLTMLAEAMIDMDIITDYCK